MEKAVKYTKVKVIKITEVQYSTLKKLDSYNINVAQFIRDAIAEKIKREYNDLIPKTKKEFCPFQFCFIIINYYICIVILKNRNYERLR